MGLATCPEGTLSGSLLGEYGLMVLCSTWLSGEVGASSKQPASAYLPVHTHRHFHTLTSDLTYSWDVPGEVRGIVLPTAQAGIQVGVWGRGSLFSTPFPIPDPYPIPLPISFDVILLQLFKYFLKLFNPWGWRLEEGGGDDKGSRTLYD